MTRTGAERVALAFEGVGFAYDGRPVLERIDLTLPAGGITALMGPSGSGKSTALALAAGLLAPSAGRVSVDAERIGVVFQDPRLLPWRSALDNVAFALKSGGLPADERRARARQMLLSLGLADADLAKFPRQLSGGMRARTALARALVIEPDLLLLDEPLAALDRGLAAQLQDRILDYVTGHGAGALIVTHAVSEALHIARRIAVLSPAPGRLVMVQEVPESAGPDRRHRIAAEIEAMLAVASDRLRTLR